MVLLRQLDWPRWCTAPATLPGRNDLLGLSGGSSITRSIYPGTSGIHRVGVEITNLTINPGDLVTMLICTAQGAGFDQATIYFGNQTSGISTSYHDHCAGGHQAGKATAPNGSSKLRWSTASDADAGLRRGVLFDMRRRLDQRHHGQRWDRKQHQPRARRRDGFDRSFDHAKMSFSASYAA